MSRAARDGGGGSRRRRGWLAAALAVVACGGAERESAGPPTAQPGLVEALRLDAAAERHPADGGGRAWLEEGEPVEATERGRWVIGYEAGPLGVAEGGVVFLQVSPFWGWSTPQVEAPGFAGYTEVSTDAEGVDLTAETVDQQLLAIHVGGRPLAEGERLWIVYGAEPGGAVADRFAESRSPFHVAVDGDGDGVRALVPGDPAVAVRAHRPARLVATLPSTARPGEPVRLTLAVLDRGGSAGVEIEGEIELSLAPGLEGSASVSLTAADRGLAAVELTAPSAGTYVVRAEAPGGLVAESNPLVVSEGARILWGDLHGHSVLSDGTGTPEEYYRYARDAAALDVVALTDHDHWGMRPLVREPGAWREIAEAAASFHRPGEMVALLGFEWTNWIHGHRHVLYFDDPAGGDAADVATRVIDSLDPATDSPAELWAALEGREALTFAHHSAGGPIATDWSAAPDPRFEPVTEVSSVHGSSEAADSPGRIYAPVPGNYVRDQLDRGFRLGLVGSGDSHDGHPGLAHLVTGQGGLAGILAEEATREAVLAALRARRVYATNGPRIVLRTSLEGSPMGATLPGWTDARELVVEVAGTTGLERVEAIRSGQIVESVPGEGRRQLRIRLEVVAPRGGEYLYLRAIQDDGGVAWSSPYFFE